MVYASHAAKNRSRISRCTSAANPADVTTTNTHDNPTRHGLPLRFLCRIHGKVSAKSATVKATPAPTPTARLYISCPLMPVFNLGYLATSFGKRNMMV